ncbi:hypothetical protein Nepgr_010525 [Nepenthes gracilis]|uniref:Pentatricopeptide repeat-containing protein n=1 Tax=Nepenthes gracilis TaxID=150966 RepID=A0AAD3XLE6_NEPGR|nr:hypothetical protein Nepgr_010525 [Nepenthes gracilis]
MLGRDVNTLCYGHNNTPLDAPSPDIQGSSIAGWQRELTDHPAFPQSPVQELDDYENQNPRAPDPSIDDSGPPTSLSPVHGSMMNEATISIGNIPQATVKVETNIATYVISGSFLPRMPFVPCPVFQVMPSLQTSLPPPVSGSGTMTRTTQPMQSLAINSFILASSNLSGNEMDLLMLITAYGKQGDFIKAERVLSYMNRNGYVPSVGSHTALMEGYGRGGQYNKAKAVFRRMQTSGPEPCALIYQIILKISVEGNKFKEAEAVFEDLIKDEKSPLKPDQKMLHRMIYMHRKAGNYEKARKFFSLMAERGVQQSTVTYNSLMSYETNYKEVSNIYDQMAEYVSCLDDGDETQIRVLGNMFASADGNINGTFFRAVLLVPRGK